MTEAATSGRARRAPRKARVRATRVRPESAPRIGLALAGGGPLGGIYEVGALLALADSLDGFDLERARRLRRRVVRRLRRRRARQRHLAGADVPALHRGRRRRRAEAGDLPAPRVRRVRAPRGRAAAPRAARIAAIPARPVSPRRDGVVRDARARGADRRVRQPRRSTSSWRGCSPRRDEPTIFASSRASSSSSRPISTPAPR